MPPEALMLPLFSAPAKAAAPVALAPARDRLRPYQRADHDEINATLEANRAVLAVLATGLGKTVIGSELAKTWVRNDLGRVLWAVTGEELCDQARASLERSLGEFVSLERAGLRACGTRVVVGSVPTLKGDRLTGWPRDSFSLIIFDEAHHAVANTPRAIFDHFEGAKIVGLTATPTRADKKAQGIVFDAIVPVLPGGSKGRQMFWGWENGYLVKPRGWEEVIDGVDLSKIKTIAGDLQKAGVEEEMLKAVAAIARVTFDRCGARRSLVFTPGVGSAHGVAAALNDIRPGCARVVDGKTPDDERAQIVKAFARGEFQYLVNCMVFREGFDDPGIQAVVIARPTKSEGLYQQMAGRGGRCLPGIAELPTLAERLSAIAASAKPDFLLLDLTGRAGQHSLQSFVTLDGRFDEAEQKRARKIAQDDPEKTVDEVLAQARGELKKEEEARLAKVAAIASAAEVRSRGREFDPFAAYGIKDPEEGMDIGWQVDPPSEAMSRWMRSVGLPLKGVSQRQAMALRKAEAARVKAGLADLRTLGVLRRAGIAVSNIRREKARKLLDLIADSRGYAPSREKIDAVLHGKTGAFLRTGPV